MKKTRFLKVKIKSLAAESRIIRKEEKRTRNNELREALYLHRIWQVRTESRATQLAYGYIRGKKYADIENKRLEHYWESPHGIKAWARVKDMVTKYGEPQASGALDGALKDWRTA